MNFKKDYAKQYAKQRREYLKSLSPEEKQNVKDLKEWDKIERENVKKEKIIIRANKEKNKKQLAILNLMKKQGLIYYHHGQEDSYLNEIEEVINFLNQNKEKYQKYHPYIWNYQGEGNNCLPYCQFDCIFSSNEFNTIYDVPLDGSYRFSIHDSGQRGLGSFNYIKCNKVEDKVIVRKVNPGGIIPISY